MNKKNDKMTDTEFMTAFTVIVAGVIGLAVLPTLTLGFIVGSWFVRIK